MKKIFVICLSMPLLGLLASCGGSGGGTTSDTGGGGGGSADACATNAMNPINVNSSCYAYCSKDKSFCVKDDEMPSQLIANKTVKKCQSNYILIDDQCQEITLSVQGNKNNIQYNVYGNTTNTNIISDQSNYDSSSGNWIGQYNPTLKYIMRDYSGVYNYYWQSNLPSYVFPALTSTGFDINDGNIFNAYRVSPYTQMPNITPIVKFGSLTLDTSKYNYSSFLNFCSSLNNEWIKFDDPKDQNNPPQFTVKITDDKNGGNFVRCSADIDYLSNKMFKNNAPYVDNFSVVFDCNYQNKDDCKLYAFGSFSW